MVNYKFEINRRKTIITERMNSRFMKKYDYSGWQENNLSYLPWQLAHHQRYGLGSQFKNNICCFYILFLSTAPTLISLPKLEVSTSFKAHSLCIGDFFPPQEDINPIKPF